MRYRIRAADTNFADDTATTFSPAGDTVTLLAGVNSTRVVLQVCAMQHLKLDSVVAGQSSITV